MVETNNRITTGDTVKAVSLTIGIYAGLICATVLGNKVSNHSSPIIPDLNGNHFIAVTDTISQFNKGLGDTLSSGGEKDGGENKLIGKNTDIRDKSKDGEQDTSAVVDALFADLENNKANPQEGSGTIDFLTLVEEHKKAFDALFTSTKTGYHSKDAKRIDELAKNVGLSGFEAFDNAIVYIIKNLQGKTIDFGGWDLTSEQQQQLETAGRTSQGDNTFVRNGDSNDITLN